MKKIKEVIKKNKSFVVISHKNVEADALGSSLAVYLLLRKLKKNVTIINQDKNLGFYGFLPFVEKVGKKFRGKINDIYFVVDCSDIYRTGKFSNDLKGKYIVNIDHHISNACFGNINWIDPKSSSTSEMIYRLYRYLGVPFDKKIATCLYAGIVSDTGSFSFANTTTVTHQVASRLLEFKIKPEIIHQNIYNNFTLRQIRKVTDILSDLKSTSRGKVIYGIIKDSKFWNREGADTTEYVLSIMRSVHTCEVVMLFREVRRNKVRVNFRSKRYVDVNKIAFFFGGGGHVRAAAATVDGNLNSVVKTVLARVRKYL